MSRRGKTQTRIVVAKEDWSVRSMPWQLVTDGSSFYLYPERALYKVSLHGPKGEDWSQAHMRVDYLQGQKDDRAGREAIVPVDGFDMPVRFEGVPVRRGVVHALRLRFPYWSLNKRGPQPPMPEDTSGAREARLRMSLPRLNGAVDVDLYVSEPGQRPWVRRLGAASRDNSLLGPIINTAGQHLTGIVMHRDMSRTPTPVDDFGPNMQPRRQDDLVRGQTIHRDARGLLWLVEGWLSRDALLEHGTDVLDAGRQRWSGRA